MPRVLVPFQMRTIEYAFFRVRCDDGPTLKASGLEIKRASRVPSNCQLFLELPGSRPLPVADTDRVALEPAGGSRFFAFPPDDTERP